MLIRRGRETKLCVFVEYAEMISANAKSKLKIFHVVNQELSWILFAKPIKTKNLVQVYLSAVTCSFAMF
jgi:hypothetical protein